MMESPSLPRIGAAYWVTRETADARAAPFCVTIHKNPLPNPGTVTHVTRAALAHEHADE